MEAELFHHSRRRSERRKPNAMASFLRGAERIIVKVTDLSLEGVGFKSPLPLDPGTVIWLKLPLLACREAKVIWCDGSQTGCEFAEPLHPMMFDTLTRPRPNEEMLLPGRSANEKIGSRPASDRRASARRLPNPVDK